MTTWLHSVGKPTEPANIEGTYCLDTTSGNLYQWRSNAVWSEVRPLGDADGDWQDCAVNLLGDTMLAAEWNGRLWCSRDYGVTWSEVRPSGIDADASWTSVAMDADGSVMFVADYDSRTYASIDFGNSWTEVQPMGDLDAPWKCVACSFNGSILVAADSSGSLFTSSNLGATWSLVTEVPENRAWWGCSTDYDGSTMLAIAFASRIWMSLDYGETWAETRPIGDVDASWKTCSVSADGLTFVASCEDFGLWITKDAGTTWTEVPVGEGATWRSSSVSSDGSVIVVSSDVSRTSPPAHPARIWRSIDSGITWSEERPVGDFDRDWACTAMNELGTMVLAGDIGNRLWLYGAKEWILVKRISGQGPPGSSWSSGEGVPTFLARIGDFYIDTLTNDIYEYVPT